MVKVRKRLDEYSHPTIGESRADYHGTYNQHAPSQLYFPPIASPVQKPKTHIIKKKRKYSSSSEEIEVDTSGDEGLVVYAQNDTEEDRIAQRKRKRKRKQRKMCTSD